MRRHVLPFKKRGGARLSKALNAGGMGRLDTETETFLPINLGGFFNYGARRLTPIECERLMGFPDNYTLSSPLPDVEPAAEDTALLLTEDALEISEEIALPISEASTVSIFSFAERCASYLNIPADKNLQPPASPQPLVAAGALRTPAGARDP